MTVQYCVDKEGASSPPPRKVSEKSIAFPHPLEELTGQCPHVTFLE